MTPDNDIMHVSSKFGQKYSCYVPALKLQSSEDDNSPNEVDPSTVTKIIDESFEDNCIEFNKGWWTYKVCHKRNVTQYHISGEGEIGSKVTLLGLYESEDDWTNKDLNDKKTKQLYHSTTYTNGSKCDLTGGPRKTTVQYYCAEGNTDMVIRVEEPATCQYIMTVHSVQLCDHPAFHIEEKTKKVNLVCSPALNEKAYNKYLLKSQKKKDEEFLVAKEKEMKKKEEKKNELKLAGKKKDKTFGLNNIVDGFFETILNTEDLFGERRPIDEKEALKTFGLSDTPSGDEEEDDVMMKFDEITEEGNEDSVNVKVAKEFKKLDENSNKFMDSTSEKKESLEKEFAEIKASTLKEMEKSEKLMNQLRAMKTAGDKDGKEQKELDSAIDALDENINKYQERVNKMSKRMAEVNKLEEIAERKLDRINKQIQAEKLVQSIASKVKSKSKRFNSIQDAVKNMFKSKEPKLDSVQDDHVLKEDSIEEEEVEKENGIGDKKEKNKKSKSLFDALAKQLRKLQNVEKGLQRKKRISKDNDLEEGTMDNGDVQVRVRSMNAQQLEQFEKENKDNDNFDEVNAATKKMEEEVRKQLQEAGLDVKDKIKIKVITTKSNMDKFDSKDLLSTEQAGDIKDMFLNILGGGQEKKMEEKRQLSLEENYNTIWSEDEEEGK